MAGGTSYSSLLLKAELTYSRLLRALSRLVLNTSKDRGGTASPVPFSLCKVLPCVRLEFPYLWASFCSYLVTLSRGITILGLQPDGACNEHRRQYSGPALMVPPEVPHPSLLKEGARSPPLMIVMALGTLSMLLIKDWPQQ